MKSWRDAWQNALYGPEGFFLRSRPVEHFRTSVNSSDVFAEAIWGLVRTEGFRTVVDVGAGNGELLAGLHRLSEGELDLLGVELAGRPDGLPAAIGWQHDLPPTVTGLLIANEWLDNIPCDVVEVDPDGVVRQVLVDPATGEECPGEPCEDPWLDRWWPLNGPGDRAEIGSTRDEAWKDAVSRVDGMAIAVDYGHTAGDRPLFGSLRSYRQGTETDVVPDGTRDVTAHVAVDSAAEATGAILRRQSEALLALGVSGTRPPLELAKSDPAGYVRALSGAALSAELLAHGGWGNFWWIIVDTRAGMQD